jgi:protein-L-isoaspartate(D-aspartate) O-methyltransferase
VHIGAGVGYYTAILARLVGRTGRVTAIELDPALAERLAANLAGQRNIRIVQGDGAQVTFEPADCILVNAGATRPADAWIDRLVDGGRLILPLTASGFPRSDVRRGAVFCITRRGDDISRRSGSQAWRSFHAKACATPNPKPRSTPHSRADGSAR